MRKNQHGFARFSWIVFLVVAWCSWRNSTLPMAVTALSTATTTTPTSKRASKQQKQQEHWLKHKQSPPRAPRKNEDVRAIMTLLRDRYDDSVPSNANATTATTNKDWHKLRRYLYDATKHRGLDVAQVQRVLAFLHDVFPDDLALQRSILQASPRILNRSVRTHLTPTAEFLTTLYGDNQNSECNGLTTSPSLQLSLPVAVSRNPDLLLTAGTGYKDTAGLDLVKVFLRDELQMSPAHIQRLQSTSASLFQVSIAQLLSVVTFFREALTVAPEESSVLTKSTEDDEANASATTTTIRKLLLAHPTLWQLSVPDNLQPRLDYLRRRCGLTRQDLPILLKRSSSAGILGLSVERNLAPKLDVLQAYAGGGRPSRRGDSSTTTTTGSDNNNTTASSSAAFLRKCILPHPSILGLSSAHLQEKLDYLESVGGPDLPRRVLTRAPAVVSLSHASLADKVEFLSGVWGCRTTTTTEDSNGTVIGGVSGGMDDNDDDDDGRVAGQRNGATSAERRGLAALLGEYPSVLTMSLSANLQPTVRFYQRANYVVLDDEGCWLDGHVIPGRYLSASLFHRLLPRWQFYGTHIVPNVELVPQDDGQDDGTHSSRYEGHVVPGLPLHVLAGTTDRAFCAALVGMDDEDDDTRSDEDKELRAEQLLDVYLRFKAESVPRLKFSSQFDTWIQSGTPIDV